MLKNILKNGVISKFLHSEEEEINVNYKAVPFTLTLVKRKYEEEQFAKYGLAKKKLYEFKEL